MKRVLSLVLAFVLVLGMVPAVNFAAVDSNIQQLVDLGIVRGTDEGLELDSTFTRAQLAVMLARMNNAEEAAANYPGDNPFSDMEGHWAANYVAYAANQGWVQGDDQGLYNPNGLVEGRHIIVTSLRVLGFEYEGAWNDAEIAAAGAEKGIAVATLDAVTRGQAFQNHYVTLFVAENAEGVILAEKYNWVTPEVPVVTELEVTNVVADNLKEIVVEFNQPVNADTVVDANFAVNKDVKVSAVAKDATTVVLTVAANLKNQEAYELTVKNVEAVAGNKMEEAKVEFTAFDRELPEVVEVVVVGPRHFNIVFSEPIKTAGTVEIKEGNTTHGNTVTVNNTNIVSVEAFTNFVEDRDYSVRVSGFEDFAEYKNVVTTREFTYNKDVNPPVATITKAEQEYIVVEFDKPVTGITAARFYHTFTAWNAVGVFHTSTFTGDDAQAVASTDYVNKVFVQFHAAGNNDSRPLPEGTVNVGIRGANIQDRWTNKLGDQMIPVSINADRTPLEITEIEVKAEDQLIVKFNKAVKEFTPSNVEILDADGKEISNLVVTTATASNNRHGVINLSTKQAGKTLTVVIKNVEEIGLSSTRIASESRLVEVTDKTAPKVAEVYYNIKLAAGKTDEYANKELFVRFDEAVDGTTALVASNYALVVGTDVTILTGTPSFDGNNTRVRIPLTNAQAHLIREGNTQGAQLQVINVKDIAGNTISPRIVNLNTNLQTDQFVKVTSVEATKTDTVVIKFNDTISGVTKDTFKLIGAGADAVSAFTLTQTVERGVTVITLVHKDKFINTNADNVGLEINFAGLKNSFGSDITSFDNAIGGGFSQDATKATLTNAFIQDKIAPEVAKFAADHAVEAVRGKHNVVVTTAGSITITFTEDIAADTVNRLTFSVQGANVQSATVENNNTIVINYTPVAGSTIEKPRVTQNVKILDTNGNSLLLTAPLNSFLPSDLVAN